MFQETFISGFFIKRLLEKFAKRDFTTIYLCPQTYKTTKL